MSADFDPVRDGLKWLDSLPRNELNAYLALFAGARLSNISTYSNRPDETPRFGKYECECVDDWRDFYQKRLVKAGFLTFDESEPQFALGIGDGKTVTYTKVDLHITDLGFDVREAWWNRLNKRSEPNVG